LRSFGTGVAYPDNDADRSNAERPQGGDPMAQRNNRSRNAGRTRLLPTVDVLVAPDNRTLVAVLENAVVAFRRGIVSNDPELRRSFHEVDRWICGCGAEGSCSFDAVCERLHLDADYLRTGLRKMKERAYTIHGLRERSQGTKKQRGESR
jgi:hypothetical protein